MKIMKLVTALAVGAACMLAAGSAYAETYYISPNGNDAASGTSPETAWASVEQVSQTYFNPGDKILFEAGGVWNGQCSPKGSGEEGNPIYMGKYGEGEKPIINADVAGLRDGGTVNLYNQSWWTIEDLELTNKGEGYQWKYGLLIYNEGILGEGYVVRNLTVHDVSGGGNGTESASSDPHWNGGILIRAEATSSTDICRVDNVTIENCNVYDVRRTGISVISNWNSPLALNAEKGAFGKNTIVRNNTLHNIFGDGIIVVGQDGGLVEHNVAWDTNMMSYTGEMPTVNVGIWGIHSKNITFRYNESYLCRTTLDGYGYDIDGDNENIVFEYNYSHDNDGGFILVVNYNNTGYKVRYNISQNDHQYQLACPHFPYASPLTWNVDGQIYNNTFYAKEPGQRKLILMLGRPRHTEIYNNIFYVEAEEIGEIPVDYPYNVDRRNNLYFWGNNKNKLESDSYLRLNIDEPGAIVGQDPKFVAAGTGGTGWDTVAGYKLFEDSPAIGAGIEVEDNGGVDYFGDPIVSNNIGAYGGKGVSYSDPEAQKLARKRDIHFTIDSAIAEIDGESVPADARVETAKPFIVDGTSMIPLRTAAEALDITVSWSFETKSVVLDGIGVDVEFKEGNDYYTSDDQSVAWTQKPVQIDGVMYIAARDLCSIAGETAVWDNGTVHITDNPRVYE